MIFDINVWVVLVAGLSAVIIGFVWYAPMVFGTAWMRTIGLTPESMEGSKKTIPMMAFTGFVSAVVLAWVMAHFAIVWGAITLGSALELGFWVWLGFMVPALLAPVLWERKSITYFAINAGYWLVTALVIATIVTLWS